MKNFKIARNSAYITAIEMIEYIEDKYSSCEEVTNNKYELLRKAFMKLHAFQQRMHRLNSGIRKVHYFFVLAIFVWAILKTWNRFSQTY